MRGVKRVANRISVPQAAPDLNRLLAALTRNADVPSDAIGIEIADDVVTLTGAVPSWRAREASTRGGSRKRVRQTHQHSQDTMSQAHPR